MQEEHDQEIIATQHVYDENSDEFATRYWAVSLEEFWEAFSSQLPSKARVLDLGCGPGRDVAEFQRRGFRVIGADFSWGLLGEAVSRVPGNFVQADMRALPFLHSTFDGVWLAASLHHIPRQQVSGVLAGVWQLMELGGTLLLAVKEGDGEGWEGQPGEERFFTFYQSEEISNAVENAGFQVGKLWQSKTGETNWIQLLAHKK